MSLLSCILSGPFSKSPQGQVSNQHIQPQENRATHWALSIIITIMIYKKRFVQATVLLYMYERSGGLATVKTLFLREVRRKYVLPPLGLTPD